MCLIQHDKERVKNQNQKSPNKDIPKDSFFFCFPKINPGFLLTTPPGFGLVPLLINKIN